MGLPAQDNPPIARPADRRRRFRIPLLGNHRLQTRIRTDDGTLDDFYVRDVGPLGIRIEFPKRNAPDLPIDDRVVVAMRLEDLVCELPAIVRWKNQHCYALEFPVDSDDENLWKIVNRLQLRWLQTRIS